MRISMKAIWRNLDGPPKNKELWSYVAQGHVPGGGLFYSYMSLVFSCHVIMDANVCSKLCNETIFLVVTLSWCGQESIIAVGQLSCMLQVH